MPSKEFGILPFWFWNGEMSYEEIEYQLKEFKAKGCPGIYIHARFGVRDKQTVKLKAYTSRPVIFEDVAVRVSPEFASYVHLDYDEANACGFRKGDLGRILP